MDTAAFVTAIGSKDVAKVRPFLSEVKDINEPLKEGGGETPLEMAIGVRSDAIIRELLRAGAKWQKTKLTLIWPAHSGDVEMARLLIAAGADVNVSSRIGNALGIAVGRNWEDNEKGFTEVVRMLIEAGADVNSGGALESAVKQNRMNVAMMLLKAGAKVAKGTFLLATAVHNRNTELALVLIPAGGEVNERTSMKGWNAGMTEYKAAYANATVLGIATQVGDEEVVKALIEAGADLHVKDEEGATALDWAKKLKHEKIANLLEAAMAKNPQKSDPGEALIFAVDGGDVEAVKKCLQAGADVNVRDERNKTKGFTPLMLAVRSGKEEIVAVLLDAGAAVDAKDEHPGKDNNSGFSFVYREADVDEVLGAGYAMHRTALGWAAAGSYTKLVQLLIARGSDVNAVDRVSETPLTLAARKGSVEIVTTLMKAGADVNARNRAKETALSLAAKRGHLDVVTLLLDAKAKLELKDGDGNTPLVAAASQAQPEIVALLLKMGADLRAVNRQQETALHAVLGRHLLKDRYIKGQGSSVEFLRPKEEIEKTVRVLLEAGVDKEAKDKSGSTALQNAEYLAKKDAFFKEIAKLIQEAPAVAPVKAAAKAKPAKPKEKKVVEKRSLPELAKPDFSNAAKSKEYDAALVKLEKLCGSKRQPFKQAEGGFTLHVHSDKQSAFDLKKVHAGFLKEGFYVFHTMPENEQTVAVLPTDKLENVIATMQTNGQGDLMPAEVAAWMKELAKEQSIIVTGVGFDFLSGWFTKAISKPAQLAKRMAEFCPDIAEGFEGDMKAMAEELRTSRKLFFWWD